MRRKPRRWRFVIPCYACGRADYRSPTLDCSAWCDCGVAGAFTENGTWIEEVRSIDRMQELFGPMDSREALAGRIAERLRGDLDHMRDLGTAVQRHVSDSFKLSPEARKILGEILEREGYRPSYVYPLPPLEVEPFPEFRYHVPFMRYGNPSARAVTILVPLDEIDEPPTAEHLTVIELGPLARTTPAMSEPSDVAHLPSNRESPAPE